QEIVKTWEQQKTSIGLVTGFYVKNLEQLRGLQIDLNPLEESLESQPFVSECKQHISTTQTACQKKISEWIQFVISRPMLFARDPVNFIKTIPTLKDITLFSQLIIDQKMDFTHVQFIQDRIKALVQSSKEELTEQDQVKINM